MERTLSTKEAEEILGRYDALASLGLKADLAEVTEDIASLVATIRALRKEQPDE